MDQKNLLKNPVNLSPCACLQTCLQLQHNRLSYRNTAWWKYVIPGLLAGIRNTLKALHKLEIGLPLFGKCFAVAGSFRSNLRSLTSEQRAKKPPQHTISCDPDIPAPLC